MSRPNLAKQLRTEAERTRYGVALVFSIVCWAALAISIVGAAYGVGIAMGIAIAHALYLAYVRGNGVRIGPKQLPHIWAKVVNASDKLGLAVPPEVVLLQSHGVLNAFATRLFSRRFVILNSALVDACREVSGAPTPGVPDELDFVIGHEIGHLAAGHLSWVLLPARIVPWLGPAYSRACEYTCDRCGHVVVGDVKVSSRALAVLAAGGHCAAQIDLDELAHQRNDAGHFWSAIYELNSSHPYVSKRITALRGYAGESVREAEGRNIWSYPLAPMFGVALGGASSSLLVVVAMIGVMASVAIPAFMKYMARSKAAAADFDAKYKDELKAVTDEPTPGAVDMVAGDKFRWSFRLPGSEWKTISNEVARKNNPLADRWITRTDLDAHVLVIGEPNNGIFTLDLLEKAVMSNLKRSAPGLKVTKHVPLPNGRIVYISALVNGMPIAYRYGLFVTPSSAYQVLAFAPEKAIAKAEPDLLAAVRSFTAE
jgi:Zn-dependent protease with chaperone function